MAFKLLRTTILSSRVRDRRSIVLGTRCVRAHQTRVCARAQAITLMIIYDRGGINVSRARIDLFTPEGDPHAIPHVDAASRRARVATGNLSSPSPPPPLSPPHSIPLLSRVLLPVVYFSPLKLRFLTSSFATAAFTTGGSRLNFREFMNYIVGLKSRTSDDELAIVYACMHAYACVCSDVRI